MARKPKPPQLVPPQRPRARPVGEDEIALWRAAMKDAIPLGTRRRKKPAAKKPTVETPAGEKPAGAPSGFKMPLLPAEPPRAASRGGKAEPPGLDRATALKLKRGKMILDGRIDLHGMTQAAAHRALSGFILHARDAGGRCLLVITGKGDVAAGEMGVLRANLPRWLQEPPLRGFVLTAVPAQPRDGGDGAFYVLLRRKRGERPSRHSDIEKV